MIVYICTGTEQWSEIFHFIMLYNYDFRCSKSQQNLILSFSSCSVLFLVCSCVVMPHWVEPWRHNGSRVCRVK